MVIVIFRLYGFVEPLKTTGGKEVSGAFKLQADLDKEFYNQHFKAMLKRAGISMFNSKKPEIKTALVEKWNRAMKDHFI